MIFNLKLNLKKWRKKIRKTRYFAYKRRFAIYKAEYINPIMITKMIHKIKFSIENNNKILYFKFNKLHDIIFNKIKFNLLISALAKKRNLFFFWKQLHEQTHIFINERIIFKIKNVKFIYLFNESTLNNIFHKKYCLYNLYKLYNCLLLF